MGVSYDNYEFELVGKIGSMALIRKEDNDIDYNIFSRIGAQLRPGMIWVSSGATEIGRVDYMKRTRHELAGEVNEVKTDYAAQGQTLLMSNYRQFIRPEYGVRQVLVEHTHFNDPEKREHIRRLLVRAAMQNAVPIVNYNDAVSDDENRKMELTQLRSRSPNVVECVDNDETAAVITGIVRAKLLVILTSTTGIYSDPGDPGTLVERITGETPEEITQNIRTLQKACVGASRQGASGAFAKLEYILDPVLRGTTVIIGHARYSLSQLIDGIAPCTRVGIRI